MVFYSVQRFNKLPGWFPCCSYFYFPRSPCFCAAPLISWHRPTLWLGLSLGLGHSCFPCCLCLRYWKPKVSFACAFASFTLASPSLSLILFSFLSASAFHFYLLVPVPWKLKAKLACACDIENQTSQLFVTWPKPSLACALVGSRSQPTLVFTLRVFILIWMRIRTTGHQGNRAKGLLSVGIQQVQ